MFSKLFGLKPKASKAPKPEQSETYEGFRITPEPMKEQQGYRLCAVIEKEVGGELKTHRLIRADTISDIDVCREASIAKAKQMIDQLGDRLF
ncbi:HlyU family transcriptional regulator [Planktotalea sp.]|uniref:HlyU family transcriptional regulator n=1 Tax=Planktotalea sp. TaxID=2029877 RepID=UPI003297E17D